MAYFEIGFDYTKEGVGFFPQSDGMVNGYPYRRPDSVWHIGLNYDIEPNLKVIRIKNGSIMTDLLSVGVINRYQGLILSEQFKGILESFHFPKCRFVIQNLF